MVTQKQSLDFRRPVKTRGGSNVKLYEVFYPRYINGAYYEEQDDVWYPMQWDMRGKYGEKQSSVDLVNESEETKK